MIEDNIKVVGNVGIVVRNEAGEIIQTAEIPNMVVTAGKGYIASRVIGTASAVMTHMAVGTTSTAPVIGDTTLIAQLGSRATFTATYPTVSAAIVTYKATFSGLTGAVVEAGIFNAATLGTMLCRTTFGTVTLTSTDSMDITWTVTIN